MSMSSSDVALLLMFSPTKQNKPPRLPHLGSPRLTLAHLGLDLRALLHFFRPPDPLRHGPISDALTRRRSSSSAGKFHDGGSPDPILRSAGLSGPGEPGIGWRGCWGPGYARRPHGGGRDIRSKETRW